jgi:hypothetical protein
LALAGSGAWAPVSLPVWAPGWTRAVVQASGMPWESRCNRIWRARPVSACARRICGKHPARGRSECAAAAVARGRSWGSTGENGVLHFRVARRVLPRCGRLRHTPAHATSRRAGVQRYLYFFRRRVLSLKKFKRIRTTQKRPGQRCFCASLILLRTENAVDLRQKKGAAAACYSPSLACRPTRAEGCDHFGGCQWACTSGGSRPSRSDRLGARTVLPGVGCIALLLAQYWGGMHCLRQIDVVLFGKDGLHILAPRRDLHGDRRVCRALQEWAVIPTGTGTDGCMGVL